MDEIEDVVQYPESLRGAPEHILEGYKQWFLGHEKFLAREDIKQTVIDKDGNTFTININTNPKEVAKRIKNLPKKEQYRIKAVMTSVFSERGRLSMQKRAWAAYSDSYKDPATQETYWAVVLEEAGKFKTNAEIRKTVKDTYGIELTDNRLATFRKDNRDKVDKLKSEWEGAYDDFGITRKRGQVERLAYLLSTQLEKYKENDIYSTARSREIREIIKDIRVTVEGNKLQIDINGQIDITATVNMNMTLQQISQRVAVNSFIIGMVASKRGLSPEGLMSDLMTSYYRSWNGFSPPGQAEEIVYPSNLINSYDWNAIKAKHEGTAMQETPAEVISSTPADVNLKNKLLALISGKIAEFEKGGAPAKKMKRTK